MNELSMNYENYEITKSCELQVASKFIQVDNKLRETDIQLASRWKKLLNNWDQVDIKIRTNFLWIDNKFVHGWIFWKGPFSITFVKKKIFFSSNQFMRPSRVRSWVAKNFYIFKNIDFTILSVEAIHPKK